MHFESLKRRGRGVWRGVDYRNWIRVGTYNLDRIILSGLGAIYTYSLSIVIIIISGDDHIRLGILNLDRIILKVDKMGFDLRRHLKTYSGENPTNLRLGGI